MPAAILLAAGLSTRLGRAKQTLTLAGETLVARAARIASEAGLAPVIVVIHQPELVSQLEALGTFPVLNPNPVEGLASSIRCGITHAQQLDAEDAVLLTCDQVALTPDHLRALIDRPGIMTGSAYAGRMGIPAYFPRASFPALLALSGDTGARDLLRQARSVTNEDLILDIDTEADLARAQIFLAGEPKKVRVVER